MAEYSIATGVEGHTTSKFLGPITKIISVEKGYLRETGSRLGHLIWWTALD